MQNVLYMCCTCEMSSLKAEKRGGTSFSYHLVHQVVVQYLFTCACLHIKYQHGYRTISGRAERHGNRGKVEKTRESFLV